MKPTPWWMKLKDAWWVLGVVVAVSGAITFAVNAPSRLEAVEKKNVEQDTTLTKLGALAEQNTKILDRLTEPRVTEVEDDGEIKVMDMDGERLCCNGRRCWQWDKRKKCQH